MMGDMSEHFNRSEFICRCGLCGLDIVDHELIIVLEDVRDHFGAQVFIKSGCRCNTHNLISGGSEDSQHLIGKAADIAVNHIHQDAVWLYLENKYFSKYGIGRYDGRTHIDVRCKKARWDKRNIAKPQ